MSIEIHAREDWTANHITLHVFASGTPNTGAQIYVDLSPEQAERLAAQLLEQVKRFRELEPKRLRVCRKDNPAIRGTVLEGTTHTNLVKVLLDHKGNKSVLFGDWQGWQVIEEGEHAPENKKTVFDKGCRVRHKLARGVLGTVADVHLANGNATIQWDKHGVSCPTFADLEVVDEPLFMPGTRVQHKHIVHMVGTVEEGIISDGRVPVCWGEEKGVSWHKQENLRAVSSDFRPVKLRVRLKTNIAVAGTIFEGEQGNPVRVDVDGGGTYYTDMQDLQVIE